MPYQGKHLGSVGGEGAVVLVEKTRMNTAVAYAAKDVVNESSATGTLWTFAGVSRIDGGSGYIVKCRLVTNDPNALSAFRVHLYHTAPAVILDNAQFALLYANAAYRIGSFDLPALTTEGTGSDSLYATPTPENRMFFKCAAGSRTVYAVLECLSGYTPTASSKYSLELSFDWN